MIRLSIVAKKIEYFSNKSNESELFISKLNSIIDLEPLLQSSKAYISNGSVKPNLTLQLEDLSENIQLIKNQAFISLQLKRILKAEQEASDITKHYALFNEVIEDYSVVLNLQSKFFLEPNYKNNTYSSAISSYQRWIIDQLFIIFCFNFNHVKITNDFIKNYLIFIHQIYLAQLTTKISLRKDAMVNSETLAVIPRNSILQVYANPVNEFWVKVVFNHENNEIEGYIQSIYLKKNS